MSEPVDEAAIKRATWAFGFFAAGAAVAVTVVVRGGSSVFLVFAGVCLLAAIGKWQEARGRS